MKTFNKFVRDKMVHAEISDAFQCRLIACVASSIVGSSLSSTINLSIGINIYMVIILNEV